jgi:hypothetical protein
VEQLRQGRLRQDRIVASATKWARALLNKAFQNEFFRLSLLDMMFIAFITAVRLNFEQIQLVSGIWHVGSEGIDAKGLRNRGFLENRHR